MGLTGEKVQSNFANVWLSIESGSWCGVGRTGRILCPGSSSVSQVPMSRKWKKPFPAQDLVCAPLPWAQSTLIFLWNLGQNSLMYSSKSSIWCPSIFLRFQGPDSDVFSSPWCLGLSYWDAGPSALSLHFLAGFSSLMPLFESSCPLHAMLVPAVVHFCGHYGNIHMRAAHCSSYLLQLRQWVCWLGHISIDSLPMHFLEFFLAVIAKTTSPFI